MILICQLFHLNYCLNFLLFLDLLFHLRVHIYFHNLHNLSLHFFYFLFYFLLFCFLLFHLYFCLLDFLMLIFYQLKLNKFNNSLCLGVRFIYLVISTFFISSNAFKSFLAYISLIVLFLISLTKSLMLSYFN